MAETVVGHAGRYDDQAVRVFEETRATAVVLFVLGGAKGNGFSVSTRTADGAALHAILPGMLRAMADGIEASEGPDGVRFTTKG